MQIDPRRIEFLRSSARAIIDGALPLYLGAWAAAAVVGTILGWQQALIWALITTSTLTARFAVAKWTLREGVLTRQANLARRLTLAINVFVAMSSSGMVYWLWRHGIGAEYATLFLLIGTIFSSVIQNRYDTFTSNSSMLVYAVPVFLVAWESAERGVGPAGTFGLPVFWAYVGAMSRKLVLDQQMLRRARFDAEQAARAKESFLATMSHEIRTPLTGVLGAAELLRARAQTKEAAELSESISQAGELLLNILNDILDFSKIEAGALRLSPRRVNLAEVVRVSVESFRASAKAKNVSLTFELSRSLSAGPAWVDDLRLRQVLANLISNAIKFTHEGGVQVKATIRRKQDGDKLLIVVSDSGIGMDEAAVKSLFKPFVQADASTARRFGGTGLGLAISKRLVDCMHGQLHVESAVGSGTTFELIVPLQPLPDEALNLPTEIQQTDNPSATPEWSLPSEVIVGARILLAEDNPLNRRVVSTMLIRMGASVTFAENGVEALHRLESEPFDVVLMDVQMPEMDGLTATKRLRAGLSMNRDVPVVAFTANAFQEDRDACDDAGMDAFLSKPVRQDQLRQVVQRMLSRGYPLSALGATGSSSTVQPKALLPMET